MTLKTANYPKSTVLKSIPITNLSHDGRGIGIAPNGKTIFVDYALPNEIVDIVISKNHSRYLEANIQTIVQASSNRVDAKCPHFGVCGGCSMQHLHPDAQLIAKQKHLLEQLKHFGKVTPQEILPVITDKIWGYRRKARLGVKWVRKHGKVFVGFREKNSGLLTNILSCDVLHPSVGLRLVTLSTLISTLTIYEKIPQIEVAIGDNNTAALIFRVMENPSGEDLEKLKKYGIENALHIYLQANPPSQLIKIYPDDQNLYLQYSLPNQNLQFDFHPLDFTQINGDINPLMINQALDLLDPQQNENVLDLFCGLGNFTLPIAKLAHSVVGVEGSEEMVERGFHNSQKNGITNTQFYAENLASKHILGEWSKRTYDKILIDPPRTGAIEAIQMFPQWKPKRIVYVSCNPATLARDLNELVNNQHYTLNKVGLINMFPHTSHVEAIAMLQK